MKKKYTIEEEQFILDLAYAYLRSIATDRFIPGVLRHGDVDQIFHATADRDKIRIARSLIDKNAGK